MNHYISWCCMNNCHLDDIKNALWENQSEPIIINDTVYTGCSLSLRRHTHGPLAKGLMHMAHLSGNTSGVSKSSLDWLNYTGFPGDLCVAFFNVPPGNKDAVAPKPPSWKKKAVVFTNVTTSAYQDQLNAGFSKVCEIFKVCGIESLKYVREFCRRIGC